MAKAFQKFIQQKEKGSKKKERIRQEKKQVRKETQEYFAKKKAERYQQRTQDGFDAQPGRTDKGGKFGSDEGRQKGDRDRKAASDEGRFKGGGRSKTTGAKGRQGGDKGNKAAGFKGRQVAGTAGKGETDEGQLKSDRPRFDDRTRFDKEAKGRGSFAKKSAHKGRKTNRADEGKNWKTKKGRGEEQDSNQSAASFGKNRNFQRDRDARKFQENAEGFQKSNFHHKKDKGFKPSRIQTGKAGTDIGASLSQGRETSDRKRGTFNQENVNSSKGKAGASPRKTTYSQYKANASHRKASSQGEANFSEEEIASTQGKITSSREKTASSQGKTSFSQRADSSQGRAAIPHGKSDAAHSKPGSFKSKEAPASGKQSKSTTNTSTGKNTSPSGKDQRSTTSPGNTAASGEMPLNKFIAHSGICSRRDAADMVKAGKVTVNGTLVNEPGFKVTGKDLIKVNGKAIAVRRNLVYILLNKPKDFITTTEDPQGRKTVLDIVRNATTERVYPIGRLDRNTTGVLLLTNDGELAQKLAHPSYEIKKIYEVTLDRPLTKSDFDRVANGIQLEDGLITPDALAYADAKDKSVIGIEIHSGRNRIVRRIFEAIGYDVRNLDRVMYANLTKKNVERGKWRFLTEKEVRLLKFLNASYTRNKPARRG